MAYNRRNILQRIIDIQTLTKEHTQKGVSQEWVFNNVVFPAYRISRKTYYNYLGTPSPKGQLYKLEEARAQQLQMF